MTDWGGFTEEDLRRMQANARPSNGPPRPTQPGARGRGRGQRGSGSHRRGGTVLTSSRGGHVTAASVSSTASLSPPEQRLSAPPASVSAQKDQSVSSSRKGKSESEKEIGGKKETKHGGESNAVKGGGGESGGGGGCDASPSKHRTEADGQEMGGMDGAITDDQEIRRLELSNLEKFRVQQKQIEELNKRKRQLLASAISERKQQARTEAVKLQRVQQELERLDQLLTVDVSLIRDRIEQTSLAYMHAQKRFEKAEKEYVAAKLELYHSQELKENLTEHLYTVIHQNEIRKAGKLKELMSQLELEDAGGPDLAELMQSVHMPLLTVLSAHVTRRGARHSDGAHPEGSQQPHNQPDKEPHSQQDSQPHSQQPDNQPPSQQDMHLEGNQPHKQTDNKPDNQKDSQPNKQTDKQTPGTQLQGGQHSENGPSPTEPNKKAHSLDTRAEGLSQHKEPHKQPHTHAERPQQHKEPHIQPHHEAEGAQQQNPTECQKQFIDSNHSLYPSHKDQHPTNSSQIHSETQQQTSSSLTRSSDQSHNHPPQDSAPTSNLQAQTSGIGHPTSNLQAQTSGIGHPTSNPAGTD